jgi:hypothetical protein
MSKASELAARLRDDYQKTLGLCEEAAALLLEQEKEIAKLREALVAACKSIIDHNGWYEIDEDKMVEAAPLVIRALGED